MTNIIAKTGLIAGSGLLLGVTVFLWQTYGADAFVEMVLSGIALCM